MIKMTEILSHDEKQIVLYSKGHFIKTNNIIDDLKAITAETYEIPIEFTLFHHVYGYITRTFLKLQSHGYFDEDMESFLCSLFKWNTTLKPEDMIEKMISWISTVKAAGLNLGEADPKYIRVKKVKNIVNLPMSITYSGKLNKKERI
jgi:hypothetical protein